MRTYSNLLNLATTLAQNQSAANQTLFKTLLSEQHRLLIENYFDNERTFQTSTVGAQNLKVTATINQTALSATLTGTWNYPTGTQNVTFTNTAGDTFTTTALLASGAISATLASNWTGPTGLQSITFTNANNDIRAVEFTNGSASITWSVPLASATTSTTITRASTSQIVPVLFENNSATINWTTPLNYSISDVAISTGGFQKYKIPANISKITNSTISIGQMRFVPAPVQTRTQWDNLNFLPYPSDIPNYYFLYGGNVEFWPVPSTTGNIIQFNYKSRVQDFSNAFLFSDTSGTAYVAGQTTFDYQNGAITTATNDGITITGTGTSWNTTGKFPTGDVSNYNLYLTINPPYGDGLWYPIQSFTNDTTLILASPLVNPTNVSNVTHNYSIGQLPILQEDFHETIVYGALMMYFSTIVPDPNKYKQFENEYNTRIQKLAEYAGAKQVDYNLGSKPVLLNPNGYPFYPGNVQS